MPITGESRKYETPLAKELSDKLFQEWQAKDAGEKRAAFNTAVSEVAMDSNIIMAGPFEFLPPDELERKQALREKIRAVAEADPSFDAGIKELAKSGDQYREKATWKKSGKLSVLKSVWNRSALKKISGEASATRDTLYASFGQRTAAPPAPPAP